MKISSRLLRASAGVFVTLALVVPGGIPFVNAASIAITDVNGQGNGPFTCESDPQTGTITVSGSGSGSSASQGGTDPGPNQNYQVLIDWGDGETTNNAGTGFNSGNKAFTFSFTGGHEYDENGSYSITAKLYHGATSNVIGTSAAVSICIGTLPPETASLTVIKNVINDNDDAGIDVEADTFTLWVKQGNDTVESDTGSEEGTTYELEAGTYIVGENDDVDGYTMTGISGACDPETGSVTLEAGDDVTCTITNNDDPVLDPEPGSAGLTVYVNVSNDNNGTSTASDFSFLVDNSDPSPSSFVGSEAGTSITLQPGTYAITQDGSVSGYTSVLFSDDCEGELGSEQTATCTVTISDDGTGDGGDEDPVTTSTINVVTLFVNDDGGTGTSSDAPMTVTALNATPASFQGSATGIAVVIDAGEYTVAGGTVAGYAVSVGQSCTGTVAAGATVDCTVTYDDEPTESAPTGDPDGPRPGSHANPDGQVLGASTEGEVLGASTSCPALLTSYLSMGDSGSQVSILQAFLNAHMAANLPVSGLFGPLTLEAVKAFQLRYAAEILAPWYPLGLPEGQPTGIVYKTTQVKINNLSCPGLNLPMPQIP